MNEKTDTPKKDLADARIAKVAIDALTEMQNIVGSTEHQIEQTVAPIRESVIKRFPIVFMLAVTFGFTATITGIEQLIMQYDLLHDHPGIMLSLGIGTLVLTGTLYKKLG